MKILITGGTGFIGREIVKIISKKGWEAVILVRQNELISENLYTLPGIRFVEYEYGLKGIIPSELISWSDGIINLAGEPIFSFRWTREKKKKILASRIAITRQIVKGLEAIEDDKKRVLINASAVGYYGDRGSEKLRESDHPGDDFLAKVCRRWESEAIKAQSYGVRVVLLRTGIVLGKDAGALKKMITPFKFGLGGPLGEGSQYFSWIHLEDIARAYIFALENADLQGAVNASAPNPVTMKEFARVLGKILGKSYSFSTPEFILDLMMGEVAKTVTTGQRVIPFKLLEKGFKFKYPFIYKALEDVRQEK